MRAHALERTPASSLPAPVGGARRRLESLAYLLAAACVAACETGATQAFEQRALPVLESRCLTPACHGVARGEPWPQPPGFFVRLNAAGAVADVDAARAAARARVTTRVAPELSSLLRRPMPAWADGGPHFGGALFTGPDDPAALALARWIDSEPDGAGEDLELDPLQEQFARDVLPSLVTRCARDGCHGPADVAFSVLSARPARDGREFASREVIAAYQSARKHLDLWSDDPHRSRLLQKALGEADGGITHRGSIGTLFPDSPPAPVDAILAWARAERQALGIGEESTLSGLVYVQGPPAPRAPYRIEKSASGADLYYAPWPIGARAPTNLTRALRRGEPAEVREPAVSHDGKHVVFAMRLEREHVFSLWELSLESGDARKLRPSDVEGSFVAPRYAPDGSIVAVWDGHGEIGSDGGGVPPELVSLDAAGQQLTRLTYTPVAEVAPSFIPSGKAAGTLVFGTRRAATSGDGEGVLFRFPLCRNAEHHGEPEYHVHFGASIAPFAPLSARDLPDGRQLLLVLASSAVSDDRGQLALLDRSLGPALTPSPPMSADWLYPPPAQNEVPISVGGYRAPFVPLDASDRFRDPAPLPDGTFLVSIDSVEAPGEDRIVRARVVPHGKTVKLELGETLLAAPGQSLRGAAPVFVRPPEDPPHPRAVDTAADRGRLVLRDVRTLEALYGRTPPRGERVLRDDIEAVRVLLWPGTAADSFVRNADGASIAGLTRAAPVQLLGELPLEADGSLAIDVPARAPLRLQWLDARGMVVGNQLDRYYYVEGNERLAGGTNPESYAHVCAGCHGSLSGDPNDAHTEPPDALSSASLTLATHELRNPRLPRAPAALARTPTEVDFVHDIAPLLSSSCAGADCHQGSKPAAGLLLDDARAFGAAFSLAYERLLAHVDRRGLRARGSALIERLSGQELDAPSALQGSCPPGGADPELLRVFARWIETGAFYDLSRVERVHAP